MTEDLHKLFELRPIQIRTRGTEAGIILRFRTFYLKIYDAEVEQSYAVFGFRYHEKNPVFKEIVPASKFGDFAHQFNKEDYLNRYTQDNRM